jgi:two-component system nitrate/nitrite response regulator NarL
VRASVLIVDDHDSFRRLARKLLERSGYSVVGEAVDGASALAAVDDLQPDVVLLDVLLPDTSGFALADQIAARSTARQPLVLLTSSRSAADYGAALRGRRFLAKNELSASRLKLALGGAG